MYAAKLLIRTEKEFKENLKLRVETRAATISQLVTIMLIIKIVD